MTVEVRTRRPVFFARELLPSCAGGTQTEKERALAASGKGTTGSAAASRDVEHTKPAARNSRYTISCDGVLLLSLPPSPQPNDKVIMRPTGSISLQSAGSQRKANKNSDSNFLPFLCRARFSREGISCCDTKQLGTFGSDQVMANDKAQNQNLRQHHVVVLLARTNLPVVAGFAKAEI
jgi:hypothetical protein